jgi:uncharacterized membrane protein/nitrite reductase/ring-hydroxylating ferredoxin subunit
MRSIAHFKSHPLHPMLIAFPVAFFTGSLLADAAGWQLSKPELWQTGYWLQIAGIAFGLIAGFAGFMDYIAVVPPDSTAKKRAAKHGILNVIVIAIFSFTWFYRRNPGSSVMIVIALDVIGVILLSASGWLGGTLVYRNQIAVDHRYAFAGKWNEKRFQQESGNIEIGDSAELKINQMKLLHFGERRIVLGRTDTGFAAFDDRCTHRGGSLADGILICGTVQCPWHGSQFDVLTGAVKAGPAEEKINAYKITEQNGKLFIQL